MTRRLAAGAACIALSTLAVLLAHDVWASRKALRDGDLRAAAAPVSASAWSAGTVLPGGVGRAVLGIGDDLAYRRLLLRASEALDVRSASERSAQTAPVEVALTRLEGSHDRARAAEAADILGVLLYLGGDEPATRAAAAKAVVQFRQAVRLDPEDADAKLNLELMLRETAARRSSGNAQESGGDEPGRSGVGVAPRGRGY
jgi:hypothetical protein